MPRLAAAVAMAVVLTLVALGTATGAFADPGTDLPQTPSATPTSATETDHGSMEGMDHGSADHGSSDDSSMDHGSTGHSTTDHGTTDHGTTEDHSSTGEDEHDDHATADADGHEASDPTTETEDESEAGHGHGSSDATPVERPRSAVIGGFTAVNGAVLLAADIMRRRVRLAVAASRRRSPRPAK